MKSCAIAAATAALLALGPAAGAMAAPPEPGTTILKDALVGPMHLSVGPGRVVTVSSGSGLTHITRKTATPIYDAPDWDVTGTAHQGSTLFFLESQGAGSEDTRPLAGSLKAIDDRGRMATITDQLGAYETAVNPDGDVQYGLSAADAAAHPQCVSQLGESELQASYRGEIDSHPYAVAVQGNTAYVADAGMKAVLSVDLTSGEVRTVAVLPPRPALITQETSEKYAIPDCKGLTYNVEAVPTDVEVSAEGLYVSSLPGGLEDPILGARGAIFRIDPATGKTEVHVEGLLSPTGIALDGAGNLYVASLSGEGVLRIPAATRTATLYLAAREAADVEVSGSTLYATTGARGNGAVISTLL